MRGLNSGCVDMIYPHPPFNSNRNYGAPIGSKAERAEFKDMWTLDDVKDEEHISRADEAPQTYKVVEAAYATAGRSVQAYLILMAVRLPAMNRLLRRTGSLYPHCDPTAESEQACTITNSAKQMKERPMLKGIRRPPQNEWPSKFGVSYD